MTNFEKLCQTLELEIESSYTEGVTMEQAEKLAGQFLQAQMQVSVELKKSDLDSRMRKSGLKAVKAAVYMEVCNKSEKKPTEGALEHMINMNGLVSEEQNALDSAEVIRDELERYYNIFINAHIYYRGIAKGNFNNG